MIFVAIIGAVLLIYTTIPASKLTMLSFSHDETLAYSTVYYIVILRRGSRIEGHVILY